MAGEITVTFEADADLVAAYKRAAEHEGLHPDQGLRDFMSDFIEDERRRVDHPGLISAQERRERAAADRFARASVALEGFHASQECVELERRYINGEIESADVIAALNKKYDV